MTYDINIVLKNVTTLEDLQKISKKARQNITFFGYRYLKYDGYKGTTSIYQLQEKLNAILDKSTARKTTDIVVERAHTMIIKRIILELGVDNFNRKTNIITRIILLVRDFFYRLTASGSEVQSEVSKYLNRKKQRSILHDMSLEIRNEIIQQIRNPQRQAVDNDNEEIRGLDSSIIMVGEPSSDGSSSPDSPSFPRREGASSPPTISTSDPS